LIIQIAEAFFNAALNQCELVFDEVIDFVEQLHHHGRRLDAFEFSIGQYGMDDAQLIFIEQCVSPGNEARS
jgi:hypothetical protein